MKSKDVIEDSRLLDLLQDEYKKYRKNCGIFYAKCSCLCMACSLDELYHTKAVLEVKKQRWSDNNSEFSILHSLIGIFIAIIGIIITLTIANLDISFKIVTNKQNITQEVIQETIQVLMQDMIKNTLCAIIFYIALIVIIFWRLNRINNSYKKYTYIYSIVCDVIAKKTSVNNN